MEAIREERSTGCGGTGAETESGVGGPFPAHSTKNAGGGTQQICNKFEGSSLIQKAPISVRMDQMDLCDEPAGRFVEKRNGSDGK